MDTNLPEGSSNKPLKFFQLPLILGVIGALVCLIGLRLVVFPVKEPEIQFISEASVSAQKSSEIKIDISGAVVNPGVYQMNSENRIQDVIARAGGLSEQADRDWVAKQLNLAAKLIDGSKIYIPTTGEIQTTDSSTLTNVTENLLSNHIVNINNASIAELDTLSGVGEVTAQKIIDGRPYQTIEELVSKKIISKSVFEKIKEKISVY